jgi:hypothetical protein
MNPLQQKVYDAVSAALPFAIDPAKITVEPGLSSERHQASRLCRWGDDRFRLGRRASGCNWVLCNISQRRTRASCG